ncbi:TetR/AcrR family transcriptional regulator [Nonomuraea sp. MG754425]|nr:TetR/AcrR family transcriptional regulator [Nonomuraea sp. MG754425]
MTRSPILRDHVAAAILDAAAIVLAERGDTASMADVAAAAGVGRTTLYRYFPNRDKLLHALTEAALTELVDRLVAARLESASVPDGIARVTRAVLGAAGKYQALAHTARKADMPPEFADQLGEPLAMLFRRGAADGSLRADLGTETLLGLYTALLEGVLSQGLHHHLGAEPAASALTSIFLDGARPR